MTREPVTVSDLAALIAAREETRAELQLLAVRAYEQWLDLQGQIRELEQRFDHTITQLAFERGSCSQAPTRKGDPA